MIRIDNIDISGFESAIRGMRNSFDSHDKSDTNFQIKSSRIFMGMNVRDNVAIGNNDLALAMKLARAGEPHCKYRRMIQVWMDITAPLYWWKQFDTYKVGTTANSESTMHNISDKEFTMSQFSVSDERDATLWIHIIDKLNEYRKLMNEAKEAHYMPDVVKYHQLIIELLPESWNQMRTVNLNYSVISNIYAQRKNHKLKEWKHFCFWIEQFPYFREMIFTGDNKHE